MTGIEVDVEAVMKSLAAMLDETEQQLIKHRRTRPSLSPAAAGRGFEEKGQELAQLFDAMHQGIEKHITAFAETTTAAAEQVKQYSEADQAFSGELNAVEGDQ